MSGFTITEEKDSIVITIDKKSDLGPSKSGKTQMIASSHGAIKVQDDITINLNVYRPKTM